MMKLTKEIVEVFRGLVDDNARLEDLCADWLAMRAMLEDLMEGNDGFCGWCFANNLENEDHKDDCKLKELLG